MSDSVLLETRWGPMMALAGDHYITGSLRELGEYSRGEVELLRLLLRPGMTAVDVGANIGALTLPLAQACAPGPVFAFEPQQRVFQLLCANVAMNNMTNVLAYPDALARRPMRLEVPEVDYAAPSYNFGSVAVREPDRMNPGGPMLTVRAYPLDELGLEVCDLIKIDVEGYELEVLAGAHQTIDRTRPILYVENDRPAQQGALIKIINRMGYRQFWHVSPLGFEVFGPTASFNMLCLPNENKTPVTGLEAIDPSNWRSPINQPAAFAVRA